MDHHLGLLFEELERRGALENTLVIITSDHGEQFGEHGLMVHSGSLYMPLLHVPLLMVLPSRLPSDSRIDAITSLRDLSATVAELTGIPGASPFPGKSLSRYWAVAPDSTMPSEEILLAEVQRVRPQFPDWYPARKGKMKSVIFDGMHYIKNYGDGREELYNLRQDLEEEQDLSESDPQLVTQFQRYLEQMMQDAGDHPQLTERER